ncbi:hypothetical protein Y032_0204g1865 [Ancylostoma ceylanicum]|uniref:Cytochrome b5 heme-binding domain-containing protein n=1 Tax=Ancylostoma ceylanicum TaxID=53326 RepID=A0A016SMJ4_9BILA|nr:hypothetical protein Y032_0204g1865 [Ancylostoma ceylanicum]
MTDNLKEFSLAEVEKHNTIGSCWIVLDGKVYDVSKFLDEHPGGLEVIAELAGKDATASFEDVGHSKDARDMAKEYLIGKVQASSAPAASSASEKKTPGCGCNWKDIVFSPTWSNFIIPTTIGIIVFVLYKGVMKAIA